jgi:hypothetical protein
MASQASSVVESGRDAVVIASFDSYRRAEHMLISLSSASRSRSSWAPSAAAASPHSMPIGPVRIEPRVAAVVPGSVSARHGRAPRSASAGRGGACTSVTGSRAPGS